MNCTKGALRTGFARTHYNQVWTKSTLNERLAVQFMPFTAIHGSIRFSLSKYTTEKEIDYVCEKMPSIIEKLTNISPFQDELAALKKLKK